MRQNHLKPGERGPNNNARELSGKGNNKDLYVIPLGQIGMRLWGKPVFRVSSLQESWKRFGFPILSWFPLAGPMDSKLVQNVPVATDAEWKELIHSMGTEWWNKWFSHLDVSYLY